MATNLFSFIRDLISIKKCNLHHLHGELDLIIADSSTFVLKKHDITTTVGMLKGGAFGFDHDLLVKRFNCRGGIDLVFRGLFFSRAARLYKISRKLFEQGLPVPRPVCCIRPSFSRKNSFFISEAIKDAENLGYLFKRGLCREPKKLVAILGKAVAAWHAVGAVHGDLKWSNILLQGDDKIFFIDLDKAKLYSPPKINGMIKDLVRFFRYGLELGREELVRSEFFPVYLSCLPEHLMTRIDAEVIEGIATKEWKRKGQRRL